nr:tyrosine-type recombinase/integrase [uncultured Pseudodesulfovibrio sp.]
MDLKYQAAKLLGKNRRAGVLTQQKNAGQIKRLCDLIQKKYGLQNLRNLKTKHIEGVFNDMSKEGLSPSTRAAYGTAARRIAEAIGKQNIVARSNKELGVSRAGDRIKPVTADMEEIRNITEQLYEKEEWLGLASKMRIEFGLRAKESLLSHEINNGALVVKGSKGGRPRKVPIRNEAQRELIKRVHTHIEREEKNTLVPTDLSLKQGLKKQANALHRIGATKENNAHAHAARHKYAQSLAELGTSRTDISEELGHGREEVVSHYIPK